MIKAPYNFVPLNKRVYEVEWADQISHDVPFSDGESGIISLTMKSDTPFFTRDSGDGIDRSSEYSAHINVNGQKKYFTPATTIKGMISNVLEIFSFGELTQFNDDFFGYRNVGKGDKNYSGLMEDEKVHSGWLTFDLEKHTYTLYACQEPLKKVFHDDIRKKFPRFSDTNSVQEKQESLKIGDKLYPEMEGRYLVCTGPMSGKKREYLFSEKDNSQTIPIPKEVLDAFMTIYKPSKPNDVFENFFLKHLKSGKDLAVFYILDPEKNVKYIGLSRMFRLPYKKRISDGVCQDKKNVVDLNKAIFGYNFEKKEKAKRSLKGRVHIGHAYADRVFQESELIEFKGVLGQPSASYYPLYLKQDGPKYTTYDSSSIELAGRKRYRIHEGLGQLPQSDKNENVQSVLKALPAGAEFKFKIKVHNLRPIELGALLSVITLNQTEGVFHNLGAAKAIGCNKVKFSIDGFDGFNNSDITHYMTVFEKEMCVFLDSPWSEHECIKTFMSISTPHPSEGLKYMTLEEYGNFKDNNNFSTLKESPTNINCFVSSSRFRKDKAIKELENVINEAEVLKSEKRFYDSFLKYGEVVNSMKLKSIDCQEYEQIIADLLATMENEKQLRERECKKEEEERRESKIRGGLDFSEAKKDNGDYLVNDFKNFRSRTDTYLKKAGFNSLPENECERAKNALRRYYSNSNLKEQLRWKNREKFYSESIEKWLGKEVADEFFDSLA